MKSARPLMTTNAAESITNGTIKLDVGVLTDPSGITIGWNATLTGKKVVAVPLSGAETVAGLVRPASAGSAAERGLRMPGLLRRRGRSSR